MITILKTTILLLFLFYISDNISYGKAKKHLNLHFNDRKATGQYCQGTEINFQSKAYKVNKQYEKFTEQHKCSPPDDPKELTKLLYEKKEKIDQLIEDLITNKEKCSSVVPLLTDFKAEVIETDIYLEKESKLRLKHQKNEVNGPDFQPNSILKVWKSILCTSGESFMHKISYATLLDKLQNFILYAPSIRVTENGETIEDCRNVEASGADNLESFFISLKHAVSSNMVIEYDTYYVADKISVLTQNNGEILSLPCVSTDKSETKKFIVPYYGNNTKIKIDIQGSCNKSSSNSGSYWNFTLSCEGAKVVQPCTSEIKLLMKEIKLFLDISMQIIDHYWMQALCHEEIYGTFEKRNAILRKLFEGSDAIFCPRGECKRIKIKKLKKIYKPLKDNKKTVPSTIDEYNHDPYYFRKIKKVYCGAKPQKDQSLLQLISWSYCYTGYDKLFNESD